MNTPVSSAARILIVEDALGVARALHRALGLHQDGLYRVETCDSGESALARLHERHFELLISDYRLPGINGLELLERAARFIPTSAPSSSPPLAPPKWKNARASWRTPTSPNPSASRTSCASLNGF
jgi:hypothetical protein